MSQQLDCFSPETIDQYKFIRKNILQDVQGDDNLIKALDTIKSKKSLVPTEESVLDMYAKEDSNYRLDRWIRSSQEHDGKKSQLRITHLDSLKNDNLDIADSEPFRFVATNRWLHSFTTLNFVRESTPTEKTPKEHFSPIPFVKHVAEVDSGDTENVPLPEYYCSLHKEGFVTQKIEKEDFQDISRPIVKRVYVVLWGTIMFQYNSPPKSKDDVPIRSISMQFAQVASSKAVRKKFPLHFSTPGSSMEWIFDAESEVQTWMDYLEMSILISSTLESRELSNKPKKRHNRRH